MDYNASTTYIFSINKPEDVNILPDGKHDNLEKSKKQKFWINT